MKATDVLALVAAGYTKAEIDLMDAEAKAATAPAPVGTPAPAGTNGTPAPAPAGTPAPAPVEDKPSANDSAMRILTALGNLAQGVSVPKEVSLDEKMAGTLMMALGIKEKEKEDNKNG